MKMILKRVLFAILTIVAQGIVMAQTPPTFLNVSQDTNSVSLSWDSLSFEDGIHAYNVYVNNELYTTVSNFSGSIDNQTVFRPVDDMVKVEAESFSPTGWEFSQEWSGYSGSGYMQAQNSYNNGQESAALDDEIIPGSDEWFIVNFRVEKAGFYRFDCRFAYNHSEANDLWIRFSENDNSFHKIGRVYNKDHIRDFKFFSWNMGERYFEPGIHKLFISPRSSGLSLDYIVIYSSDNPLITQKDDIAVILYGYWLVRAMNPDDKDRVESAETAVPESNSLNIFNLNYNENYTFELRSVDPSGKESEGIEESVLIADTVPPSAPDTLQWTAGTDFLELFWSSASDNDRVESYTIYLNGEQYKADIQDTSFTIDKLDPGTNFDIAVQAVDPSGNVSLRLMTEASTLETHTGMPVENSFSVNVFPNPVTDKFIISAPFSLRKVEIYSLTGKRMCVNNVGGKKLEMDASFLPPGIYILRLGSQTGYERNIRIIKE
jgi:chitodextrinase